jgi:hypothetical protein
MGGAMKYHYWVDRLPSSDAWLVDGSKFVSDA